MTAPLNLLMCMEGVTNLLLSRKIGLGGHELHKFARKAYAFVLMATNLPDGRQVTRIYTKGFAKIQCTK